MRGGVASDYGRGFTSRSHGNLERRDYNGRSAGLERPCAPARERAGRAEEEERRGKGENFENERGSCRFEPVQVRLEPRFFSARNCTCT